MVGQEQSITLKEQELQQRARKEDADTQIDMQKLGLDQQNQQMRSNQFQQRIASQERQTDARIDAAMQRELLKQDDN